MQERHDREKRELLSKWVLTLCVLTVGMVLLYHKTTVYLIN